MEATRGAFAQIERSFAGVRELADTPRGVLRVTAPVASGASIVPWCQPSCGPIELSSSSTCRRRSAPWPGTASTWRSRHVSVVPETHVAWTLCETRSVLVASPDYLRRRGVPADPRPWRATTAWATGAAAVLLAGVSSRWPAAPRWRCRSAAALPPTTARPSARRGRRWAGAGGAIGFHRPPGRGLARRPAGAGAARLAAGGLFGDRLCAIRPYSPTVPKAVQVFVAWLRDALKDGFGLTP